MTAVEKQSKRFFDEIARDSDMPSPPPRPTKRARSPESETDDGPFVLESGLDFLVQKMACDYDFGALRLMCGFHSHRNLHKVLFDTLAEHPQLALRFAQSLSFRELANDFWMAKTLLPPDLVKKMGGPHTVHAIWFGPRPAPASLDFPVDLTPLDREIMATEHINDTPLRFGTICILLDAPNAFGPSCDYVVKQGFAPLEADELLAKIQSLLETIAPALQYRVNSCLVSLVNNLPVIQRMVVIGGLLSWPYRIVRPHFLTISAILDANFHLLAQLTFDAGKRLLVPELMPSRNLMQGKAFLTFVIENGRFDTLQMMFIARDARFMTLVSSALAKATRGRELVLFSREHRWQLPIFNAFALRFREFHRPQTIGPVKIELPLTPKVFARE